MRDFIQKFKNMKVAIVQIRNGEWTPLYNPISEEHLTAHRWNLELWIGNGSFFCEIEDKGKSLNYFGLFWRHFVWICAARELKRNADKTIRKTGVLV